jgi:hypothetical protein
VCACVHRTGNKLYLSSQRPQHPAVLKLSDALVLATDGPHKSSDRREVLVLYQKEGPLLVFVDLGDMSAHRYFMPHHFKLNHVYLPSPDVVIVEDAGKRDHLFIGRWPIASLEGSTTQRWATLLRSPLATDGAPKASHDRPTTSPGFPAAPSTFPPQFEFMSTNAQPTTFLSSADPHRPISTYADLFGANSSVSLLTRGDIGGGGALAVHSFPRLPADIGDPDVGGEASSAVIVNERALYLRHSRQLLTLTRRHPLKGEYYASAQPPNSRYLLMNTHSRCPTQVQDWVSQTTECWRCSTLRPEACAAFHFRMASS